MTLTKSADLNYHTEMASEEMPALLLPHSPITPRPEPQPRFWALNIIGIGVVLALCYYGELVLVVMLVSVLLAFILAPIVDLMMRFRLPRGLGAAIAVLLLLGALVGIVYFSYNQASTLLQDVPKYAGRELRSTQSAA